MHYLNSDAFGKGKPIHHSSILSIIRWSNHEHKCWLIISPTFHLNIDGIKISKIFSCLVDRMKISNIIHVFHKLSSKYWYNENLKYFHSNIYKTKITKKYFSTSSSKFLPNIKRIEIWNIFSQMLTKLKSQKYFSCLPQISSKYWKNGNMKFFHSNIDSTIITKNIFHVFLKISSKCSELFAHKYLPLNLKIILDKRDYFLLVNEMFQNEIFARSYKSSVSK